MADRSVAYVSITQKHCVPSSARFLLFRGSRVLRLLRLASLYFIITSEVEVLYLGNIRVKEARWIKKRCAIKHVKLIYVTDFAVDYKQETRIFEFGIQEVIVTGDVDEYFDRPTPFICSSVKKKKESLFCTEPIALFSYKPLGQFSLVERLKILASLREFCADPKKKFITFHPRVSSIEKVFATWVLPTSVQKLKTCQYPKAPHCEIFGAYSNFIFEIESPTTLRIANMPGNQSYQIFMQKYHCEYQLRMEFS